jgi:plastocyanin
MDKKNEIMIAVGVVALVIIAVFVGYGMRGSSNNNPSLPNSGTSTSNIVNGTSTTRTAVAENVVVPNKDATGTSANVAVPTVQGAGDPTGNVTYRSFNIKIQGGKFSPDTVIVKLGDTVNLELNAVDAAYAFTQPDYGFNAPIAEGKTQTIQFQALQSGNFTFYCGSCGGPSKGPVGHIIVAAK